MKYWIDTEFIEDGKTIDLISIGIVAEDGRELYLGNRQCDFTKASQWVKDHVLVPMGFDFSSPNIPMRPIAPDFWVTREAIAKSVAEFCCVGLHGKPEIWAYYADYDWVVFCQLFGTMMDLPDGFPMYCRDIKQECDRLGNPKLPEQGKGEHNALDDARWNKLAYEFLANLAAN
jgi:hypothetical protein